MKTLFAVLSTSVFFLILTGCTAAPNLLGGDAERCLEDPGVYDCLRAARESAREIGRTAEVLGVEAHRTRDGYRNVKGAVTTGVISAPTYNLYPSSCRVAYDSRGANKLVWLESGSRESLLIPENIVEGKAEFEVTAVCGGVYLHAFSVTYDFRRESFYWRQPGGGHLEGTVLRLVPGQHDEVLPTPITLK